MESRKAALKAPAGRSYSNADLVGTGPVDRRMDKANEIGTKEPGGGRDWDSGGKRERQRELDQLGKVTGTGSKGKGTSMGKVGASGVGSETETE